MRIFYELRYAIIELVRTLYQKGVLAKFQKYLKHISWVISGTSSSRMSCNPRHPSRNIRCNHSHHLLQPSWRRIFSTSNNQKTRVDSDINSDYVGAAMLTMVAAAVSPSANAPNKSDMVLSGTHWFSFVDRQMSVVLCLQRFPMKQAEAWWRASIWRSHRKVVKSNADMFLWQPLQ